MQTSANEQYLETKVLTATPQKLHLMLIEGAIRHAQQAKAIWDEEDRIAERNETLARCIDITGEMLIGIRDSDQAVARQLVDVYAFLFRTVTEAKMLGDVTKLDDCLQVLTIERGTWQKVCAKFGETQARGQNQPAVNPLPRRTPAPLGPLPAPPGTGNGLSLEA